MKYLKFFLLFSLCLLFFFINSLGSASEHILRLTEGQSLQEFINTTGGEDATIVISDGKEYDFSNINIENKNIKVTNGTLKWNNSTLINGTLTFDGENAKGSINGGSITIDEQIHSAGISINNKAVVDVIENIEMKTFHYTIEVNSGASIGEIRSGSFENGKSRVMGSEVYPAGVIKVENAEITKITDGTFKSINGAALLLRKGAKVGEIYGGNFDATEVDYDYIDTLSGDASISNALNGFSAIVLQTEVWSEHKKAVIEKISDGNFSGYHAIHMRAGKDEGTEIGEISGGTFKNIPDNDRIKAYTKKVRYTPVINNATIYTTQKSKFGTISGGYFESTDADVVHFTWLIIDNPKNDAGIDKITGGIFVAKNSGRAIFLNNKDYRINTIENGTFVSANEKTYAIDGDGKIGEIKNGIFYGGIKTGNTSKEEPTKLEQDLSTSQPDKGNARYFHKEHEWATIDVSPRFLKGAFEYPTYRTEEGYTYSYIPSFYLYKYGEWKSGSFGFYKNENDKKINADGEYFFWSGSPLGYFDNTNKKGSYSWEDNEWYDTEPGWKLDRKNERIYSLYPTLEDANVENPYLDVHIPEISETYKMAYLRKRPILSFNANLPDNITFTGEMPKRQHIVPFNWDNYNNTIEYDTQGEHWEQVFLVPTEPGITVLSDELDYTFKAWNTKPDASGRFLKADKFYAMPLEDVTLYAIWTAKPKEALTEEKEEYNINNAENPPDIPNDNNTNNDKKEENQDSGIENSNNPNDNNSGNSTDNNNQTKPPTEEENSTTNNNNNNNNNNNENLAKASPSQADKPISIENNNTTGNNSNNDNNSNNSNDSNDNNNYNNSNNSIIHIVNTPKKITQAKKPEPIKIEDNNIQPDKDINLKPIKEEIPANLSIRKNIPKTSDKNNLQKLVYILLSSLTITLILLNKDYIRNKE